MWISGYKSGFAWEITEIDQNTISQFSADITIEDIDNYNAISGGGNGNPYDSGTYIIFQVNSSGLPCLQGLYPNLYTDPVLQQLPTDIMGRFVNTSPNTQYIDEYQPGHTLQVGDPIWLNSVTGLYTKSTNANAQYTIGIVSNIGVPDLNSFTFKVFGTYYEDVSKFFSETVSPMSLSLAAIPGVVKGSIIYIDTSGLTQYTSVKPASNAIPAWIYLGTDAVTSKEMGILSPFGGSGSGGSTSVTNTDTSGTGFIKVTTSNGSVTVNSIGSKVVLKVPVAVMNFNFNAASVIMSTNFFSETVTPAYISNGTDSTGFQIILNSAYNMSNLPQLIGTVGYWNGTQFTYMQLRFGNTNTTSSVRAIIRPTVANLSNTTGPTAYGAPLTLTLDGFSVTGGAFSAAANIGSTNLAYSLQISLDILN